jgi:transcriptional regulator with GAF, ATPase, and Fis domain
LKDRAGQFEARIKEPSLDEIGDMSLSAQTKVLRVKESMISRVGADKDIKWMFVWLPRPTKI